jgi:hypothetical protein
MPLGAAGLLRAAGPVEATILKEANYRTAGGCRIPGRTFGSFRIAESYNIYESYRTAGSYRTAKSYRTARSYRTTENYDTGLLGATALHTRMHRVL